MSSMTLPSRDYDVDVKLVTSKSSHSETMMRVDLLSTHIVQHYVKIQLIRLRTLG